MIYTDTVFPDNIKLKNFKKKISIIIKSKVKLKCVEVSQNKALFIAYTCLYKIKCV